jgi:hypothetical protein
MSASRPVTRSITRGAARAVSARRFAGGETAVLTLSASTVAESAAIGTDVGTLSVLNAPVGVTYTYAVTVDPDNKFTTDGDALETDAALNYEAIGGTSHNVTITATGSDASEVIGVFTILVTDVDEVAPTITSANSASNVENAVLAHALTANESVTWTITGGAVQALFEISGSTLRWASNGTKDFESPNDADTNNAYIVQVTATDAASNASNQTVTITVTDADDVAPTITSGSTADVDGGEELSHALTANETVTWTIIGGADAADFEISGSTLRWVSNGTKDYDNPDDADLINTYVVQVMATDTAMNTADQTITITVGAADDSAAMLKLFDITDGFAIVAPENSFAIKDTATPANEVNIAIDEYLTTVQAKLLTNEDGDWAWSAHNFFTSSGTPVTRTITVSVGRTYTTSILGTGAITLTGGATGVVTSGSPVTFTSTSTSVLHTVSGSVTRAQLNLGAVPTAYIANTGSTAARLARGWHVGEGKYLIRYEPQAVNLALWSNDLTNAAWTKTNVTATQDQTGPTGAANTATRLTATASNGTVAQTVTGSSVARTVSLIIKRLTGSGTVSLSQDNGSTWTDITSQVTASWSPFERPTVVQTVLNPTIVLRLGTSGDEVAVSFVQLETGSVATSPWPTGSATGTRAADSIRMAATTLPISNVQGTVAWKGILDLAATSGNTLWSLNNASTSESITVLVGAGGVISMGVTDGGVSQLAVPFPPGSLTTYTPGTTFRIASAWAVDDVGHCKDGGTVNGDTTSVALPTVTSSGVFAIGNRNSDLSMTGWIEEVVYDPTRRVINDDLPFFNEGHSFYYNHIAFTPVAYSTSIALNTAQADLEDLVPEMTGEAFTVDEDFDSPGIKAVLSTDPSVPADIVTALNESSGEFSTFYIQGDGDDLWIVGKTNSAVADGINYYLNALGVRWFFPGEKWRKVPSGVTNIRLSEDQLVSPVFQGRGLFAQGGFGGGIPPDPTITGGQNELSNRFIRWQARNRARSFEYSNGGHVGQTFNQHVAIRPILQASYNPRPSGSPWPIGTTWEAILVHPTWINSTQWATVFPEWMGVVRNEGLTAYTVTEGSYFDTYGFGRHPEYLAIIDDVRQPWTSGVKYDVTKPGLVKLYSDWTIERMRAIREGASADTAAAACVSAECADGGGFSNNTAECVTAGIGDGSTSDQHFYLINQCAIAMRSVYSDAMVGCYAYATHTLTPSFALEENVSIQLIPYGFQTHYSSATSMMEAWKANLDVNGAKLSIYDYWNINDNSHDEPNFDFRERLTDRVKYWIDFPVVSFNNETTAGSFAPGPAWWAAWQLSWDGDLEVDTLLEEFYDFAFGAAKAPMKEMIERWGSRYIADASEIGMSLATIDAAMTLAVGDADVQERIYDYAMYIHYLRLRIEKSLLTVTAEIEAKNEELMEHMFNNYWDHMVSAYREYEFIDTAHIKSLYAMSPDTMDHGNWPNVHTLTSVEKDAIIADGIANYPEPSYDIIDYSSVNGGADWVPLEPQVTWVAPAEGDEWTPEVTWKNGINLWVDVPTGLEEFPIRFSRYYDLSITVIDENDEFVFADRWEGTGVSGIREDVIIPLTSGPGRYKFDLRPNPSQGGVIQWINGALATWGLFFQYEGDPSPDMYFYVPAGIGEVVIYNSLTSGTGTVKRSDGVTVVPTVSGQTKIYTVAPGHDDTVWSVTGVKSPNGPIRMLTTPETFAFSPETLMVPPLAL